jgi:hypothetical protein
MYNQDIRMATNSNNNPNNDNSIEPNKKRYIPLSPKGGQKSSTNPYPQSLLDKNKDTLTPSELRAKFVKPEPTKNVIQETVKDTPTPEPIIAIESPTPIEGKNFRYEQKSQEYALPINTPKTEVKETVKIEEPKIEPKPEVAQEVKQSQPIPEPVKQAAIPITLSNSQEEVIQDVQAPTPQEVKIEVKQEPKAIPKLDVNPLPPSIEEAVQVAVAENKEPQTIQEQITRPEEVANRYVENDKYSLPGTENQNYFQSPTDRINAEITAKFAPKVEVKIEPVIEPKIETKIEEVIEQVVETKVEEAVIEPVTVQAVLPTPEVVAPVVAAVIPVIETVKIEKPIVTLDVNPLPPEIEQAVNEAKSEDSKPETLQDQLDQKPEVANKYVKNEKFKLPGPDNNSDLQRPSDQTRADLEAKFRPKAKVEQTNTETTKQESKDSVTDTTGEQIIATAAVVETPVTINQEVNLDGIKPLIKFNNDIEDSTSGTVNDRPTQGQEVIEDTNLTPAEYLKSLSEDKPEPKYTIRQPKQSEDNSGGVVSSAVTSAAIAAGAVAATGTSIGSKVSIGNGDNVESSTQSQLRTNNNTSQPRGAKVGSRISRPQEGTASSSSSQSSDPNRYISSPSSNQSSSQSSSGGRTETTTTSTSTTTTTTKTGAKITFDITRQSVRSANRGSGKGNKNQGKMNAAKVGLVAIAAAMSLNAAAGGAIAGQDSGIFDGVNSDGSAIGTEQVAKPNNNFVLDEANVGPKFQEKSLNEFGQRQGTYDADGNFTETPRAEGATGDNKPKPKAQQSQDGIPALDNSQGKKSTAEQSIYADEGSYDAEGNLKQNVISSDALDINNTKARTQLDEEGQPIPQLTPEQRENNAINNAPGAINSGAPAGGIPGQQSPTGGPATPAPSNNASQIAPSADESKGAELDKGKKESLQDKIMAAVVGVYLKQGLILLSMILLTLTMILGIALGAGYYLLAGVCSNGIILNAAATAGLAGNQGADTLYKTCEAFTAFTGIGCSSTPDTFAGNGECISDYLDATGDTVNMTGVKGSVKASKAVIKELIKLGKANKATSNDEVQMMVSIYAINSTEKGYATKDGDCLGALRLCGADYAKYTEGLNVPDEGKFLLSADLQVKAFLKQYAEAKSQVDKLPACAKEHFTSKGALGGLFDNKKIDKNSPEYKLLYTLLHNGPKQCPEEEDATKTKYIDYVGAGTINYLVANCPAFKARITTAAIYNDLTPYFRVANSISSIGSYIGNGLNKFNLSIKSEAAKALNPNDEQLNSKKGYATKDKQNEVIKMINEGKMIVTTQWPWSRDEFFGDITGIDYPNARARYGSRAAPRKNGPIHENLANFLIIIGNKYRITLSALGNNTHSYTPAWHNTDPIQAIDLASIRGKNIDSVDGMITNNFDEFLPFLKDIAATKLVLQYLVFSPLVKLVEGKVPGLNIGADGKSNHLHLSIDAKAQGGGSGLSSGLTGGCPIINSSAAPTKSTSETRLNKKSLTDDQWKKELERFPSEPEFGDTLVKIIDSQTKDGSVFPARLKLFDNDQLKDKIYDLALSAGYEFRNRGQVGPGDNDLNGTTKNSMKREVKKNLDALFKAMGTDGIKATSGDSYESPEVTKANFEKALLTLCRCTPADLLSGTKDSSIQEVFKINEVPNMSLKATGQMILIEDGENSDQTKFESTKTFKYFTEDNQFNLQRFGFTFAFDKKSTKKSPLIYPNAIIYVGREALTEDGKQ